MLGQPPGEKSTLGQRIQWALDKAGISKSALADAADVAPSAVTQWINGDTKVLKAATLLAAAKALSVDHEWLATGKGVPAGNRAEQPRAAYGLSDEALEVARVFDQLTPECQEHVSRQVQLLRGANPGNGGRRKAAEHDVRIKRGEMQVPARKKIKNPLR
jgi:transcriptional regulator with XRE-family HTH domain